MTTQTHIILHNIRSVHNVGSFFRTADASGVDKIFLTGHTPTPLDRFGNVRSDVAKVALGAEKKVSWEYRKDIFSLITELKDKKLIIASVEQDKKSIDYLKIKEYKNKNLAIIFGNEVDGLEKEILGLSDVIFEIPMSGEKESINVSVVGGIILFGRRDGKL